MQETIINLVIAAVWFTAGYVLARYKWRGAWRDMGRLYDNAVVRCSELRAELSRNELEIEELKEEYYRRGFEEGSGIDIVDEIIAETVKREIN